jgi:uncharacterized protein
MSDPATAPSASPTRMEPPAAEVSRPFWEATRNKQFLLQWCTPCDQPIFYPREVCPRCLGTELEWRPASGQGQVHAVSVQHNPPMPPAAFNQGPYVVALIDLAEGARVMSNVIGCPPDDVVVGMPVTLTWEPLSDGRHLPQFQAAGESSIR